MSQATKKPAIPEAVADQGAATAEPLGRLYEALGRQRTGKIHNARTAKLLASGLSKMSRKLVEEAAEVAIDAVRERRESVIHESADLLYHLAVVWAATGVEPAEVWAEIKRRETLFGVAEKRRKPRQA